ncbi:MAG: carboxypeptidase M32, partial [Rhodospirillales bacterium]|nr:carboxypeptidase M32 [Rhodospirillales bacterium]
MTAYSQLEEKFRTLATLEDAAGILHWDAATMMPPGSAEDRHEQLAVLATIRHDILASSETGELLAAALETGSLNSWQQANLREMERLFTHATAVETSLVTALSKASNTCETRWRRARVDNDFNALKPLLAEVLFLSREAAQAKAEKLNCTPYDALMDQFTPGLRSDMVDTLFDRLGRELPGLLSEISEHQASQPEAVSPVGPFPLDQQRALGARLMAVLGFDFKSGRLDESLHPFSGGTPDDLRITTRYEANDFMTGLMGVLHETGHALYEKNLPSDWRRQPVGAARGMDIHESQSLLIEMQACRSLEFLTFAGPLM